MSLLLRRVRDFINRSASSRSYQAATVQAQSGASLVVQLEDGHDRLVPLEYSAGDQLVGARLLLGAHDEWLVAVDVADPMEKVLVSHGVSKAA